MSHSSLLFRLRQLHGQQRFGEMLCVAECGAAPDSVLILRAIAKHCVGQIAESAALFEAVAPKVGSLDIDALVDWAALLSLRGEVARSFALLNAVLAAQPSHSLALARRAWCRMTMGDTDGAEVDMEASLVQEPGHINAWLLLAGLRLTSASTGARKGEYGAVQDAIDRARLLLVDRCDAIPGEVVEKFSFRLDKLQLICWLESGRVEMIESWINAISDEKLKMDWRCTFAYELAQRSRYTEAEESLRLVIKSSGQLTSIHVPLLLSLAEMAETQGRTSQAVQLIHQAIDSDERNPLPWANLALIGKIGPRGPALEAAEKAVALAEALNERDGYSVDQIVGMKLHSKLALAEIESNGQNYAAADELFREILAVQPWHIGTLLAIGRQELQRGRIDESIALFERVKSIEPAIGSAALIGARCFPEDESSLLSLDRAAHRPDLDAMLRSDILFKLAAAWEKRNDYDKAFAYASEANELSKCFLLYDPKSHRQKCARIRHVFTRDLYERRKNSGHPSNAPVFVLGMPRSGTTLVEQIIASHSQIFGAGELGAVPQLIAGLGRWQRHIGSGRLYPDCIDDLDSDAVFNIAEGVLKEMKGCAAKDKPEAKHVVDKLPHNFENIGLIKFLFPNARIIYVRRDYRDVAISNYFTDYAAKHGGMGFAYDLAWIGEQLADHNLLMRHWQQVFPGEILEVQYEDVVDHTEAAARKMLDYIGVPWEERVLNFNELDRSVRTASVWQVRQPIYKTSKNKWARYEKHLAPLIAGYDAKITWNPIDVKLLPEPGLLQKGVALYKANQLDEAALVFERLLSLVPGHAAASHMMGVVCAQKGRFKDAVALMEKAVETCPWNADWRKDLAQTLELCEYAEMAEQMMAQI